MRNTELQETSPRIGREAGAPMHGLLRVVGLCAGLVGMLGSTGDAQVSGATTTRTFKTGLHSVFENHAMLVTVAEVGAPAIPTVVTIEIRDAANIQRGYASGRRVLVDQPVKLRVAIPAGVNREQLRAIVTVTRQVGGGGCTATTVETIDTLAARVEHTVMSLPPEPASEEPIPNCPGPVEVL